MAAGVTSGSAPLLTSEEEVRSKPQLSTEPAAHAATDESGNYDILVLGKTGLGKSSTVDKLMVPNTRESAPPDTKLIDKQPIDFRPGVPSRGRQAILPAQGKRPKKTKPSIEVDEHRTNGVQIKNLSAWILSDVKEEHQNAETRLKNIVFSREIEDSPAHVEIDCLRNDEDFARIYQSSRTCQLLVNEDSSIRVLDTPGFFSPDLFEGAADENASNLAIVRRIVYIQTAAGLKFRRILYFLPTGTLTRDDRVIQQEIRGMARYFDSSIFTSMVLVYTLTAHVSKSTKMLDEEKFPQEELEKSRNHFHKALLREYTERNEDVTNLPKPPIIFIAMTDTCEQILRKVLSAPVENNEGLQLRFQSGVCARCGVEIGSKENEALVCTYHYGNNEVNTVPYTESTCHPKILPKVTARSFFQGLGRLFLLRWDFTEEICINPECKQQQGSRGCKRVQSKYEGGTVDHTDRLDCEITSIDSSIQ